MTIIQQRRKRKRHSSLSKNKRFIHRLKVYLFSLICSIVIIYYFGFYYNDDNDDNDLVVVDDNDMEEFNIDDDNNHNEIIKQEIGVNSRGSLFYKKIQQQQQQQQVKQQKQLVDNYQVYEYLYRNQNKHDHSNINHTNDNSMIPSRIQQLNENKQLIGRDGLEREFYHLANITQNLLFRSHDYGDDILFTLLKRYNNGDYSNDIVDDYDDDESWIRKYDIPEALLQYENTESTISSITSYLQLYIQTLDEIFKKQKDYILNDVQSIQKKLNSILPLLSPSSTLLSSTTPKLELSQLRTIRIMQKIQKTRIHDTALSSLMNSMLITMDESKFWKIYSSFTDRTLYSWDQKKYLTQILPYISSHEEKKDSSIFVSIVSYKDDQRCANTLHELFDKAHAKEQIYVGLVFVPNNDNSGYTDDCYQLFCNNERNNDVEKNIYCQKNQLRVLKMNETTSFSPYFARFFASKLWYGEQFYLQIDSNMHFIRNWDQTSISIWDMLKPRRLNKVVLSYVPYQVNNNMNTEKSVDQIDTPKLIPKICGGYFSNDIMDEHLIKVNATFSSKASLQHVETSPLVVAGNLMTTSDILKEVPFDPFLPFTSIGENAYMSSRLWTSGYDSFQPTLGVIGRDYNSMDYVNGDSDYWENEFDDMMSPILSQRIKFLLNYPESERDFIQPSSLLNHIENYNLGSADTLTGFMEYTGLDTTVKKSTDKWCQSSSN